MSNLKPSTRALIKSARYNQGISRLQKRPKVFRKQVANSYKNARKQGFGKALRHNLASTWAKHV